jgi:hypothetical protein
VKQGIGSNRGVHKQCGCQAAVGNLPATERFHPDNIFLPVLSRATVYKKHGMARVLCGVDQQGVRHDEECYAKDMRALDAGVWAEIPDDVNGGTMRIRLKAFELVAACDHLGAQSITCHVETPGAHVFCRACDCDRTSDAYQQPFSFHRAPCPTTGSAKSPRRAFSERSWPSLLAVLRRLRAGVSAAEQKKLYHDHGINKLYGALDPEHIPHIDPTDHAPQDLLHLFPDGLLRSEAAWLIYVLVKLGLSIDAINAAWKSYHKLPADVRIPPLHGKLKEGTRGGRPAPNRTLKMSGSQVMHWALHRCEHTPSHVQMRARTRAV